MVNKKKVLVKAIIEVVGKPKEHVENALKVVLEKISSDPGFKVEKKELFKPKLVENDFYSVFGELEVRFEDPALLVGFCMDYLPASIEVIEPDEVLIEGQDMGNLMNDLLSKLHHANMVLANNTTENQNLRRNADSLLKNIVMLSLKEPKTLAQMSKEIGISEEDLPKFLAGFIKAELISQEGDKYILKKNLYGDKA